MKRCASIIRSPAGTGRATDWIDRHTVPNNATTSTQLNEQSAKLAPSWPQSLQDAFEIAPITLAALVSALLVRLA
jgi:hypothetical protein